MQNMENAEEIYNKYSNIVYKYLFCLTHNEDLTQDLTQETFVIALEKINSFKGECKLSVWLCQIAKHLWFKHLKKQKKENNMPLDELNTNLVNDLEVEDIICQQEEKLNLFKNIQKLDSPYKDVVYLKLFADLNFIEIAEILNKTPNWARVTFFRAKQKLNKEEKK